MNIFALKKHRQEILTQAEALVSASENAKRAMTVGETVAFETHMREIETLNSQIGPMERQNTLAAQFSGRGFIPSGGVGNVFRAAKRIMSPEYCADFYAMVRTNGKQLGSHLEEGSDGFGGYALPAMSASLGEGTNTAGGYAVPSVVDQNIVPLAAQEMAVRKLALVIPTSMDVRIPQKGSFGTATAKAEGVAFVENDPTLSQILLSAFMAGNLEKVSWELAQDVPMFQAFCVNDLLISQAMYEENLFVNGTGTGQAQGLVGNVGAGVTCATHAFSDILAGCGKMDSTT